MPGWMGTNGSPTAEGPTMKPTHASATRLVPCWSSRTNTGGPSRSPLIAGPGATATARCTPGAERAVRRFERAHFRVGHTGFRGWRPGAARGECVCAPLKGVGTLGTLNFPCVPMSFGHTWARWARWRRERAGSSKAQRAERAENSPQISKADPVRPSPFAAVHSVLRHVHVGLGRH